MNAEAVISCPRCLRQYAVPPDMNGKLARCDACKIHFGITIVELALPGEAFTLDSPIVPRLNFMYEISSGLARNVVAMLDLAGIPATADAVAKFVKTLPRSLDELGEAGWREGACNVVMRRAHHRCCDGIEWSRFCELLEYFTRHLPSRDRDILDMQIGAFTGVLSVEFYQPKPAPCQELVKYRKRGPLERFAERMGW